MENHNNNNKKTPNPTRGRATVKEKGHFEGEFVLYPAHPGQSGLWFFASIETFLPAILPLL